VRFRVVATESQECTGSNFLGHSLRMQLPLQWRTPFLTSQKCQKVTARIVVFKAEFLARKSNNHCRALLIDFLHNLAWFFSLIGLQTALANGHIRNACSTLSSLLHKMQSPGTGIWCFGGNRRLPRDQVNTRRDLSPQWPIPRAGISG
jgi:hypothetical protein